MFVAVSGAASGGVAVQEPVTLPARHAQIFGRRIVSNLDIVEFHLPRFAHITQGKDVDYVEYYVQYGPTVDKVWLRFMFGPNVGGASPQDLKNSSITWTSRNLICNGSEVGTDWRGSSVDGRRWRHVAIPFGFAAYRDVQSKAADYFDKILDTESCGKMR